MWVHTHTCTHTHTHTQWHTLSPFLFKSKQPILLHVHLGSAFTQWYTQSCMNTSNPSFLREGLLISFPWQHDSYTHKATDTITPNRECKEMGTNSTQGTILINTKAMSCSLGFNITKNTGCENKWSSLMMKLWMLKVLSTVGWQKCSINLRWQQFIQWVYREGLWG